MSVLCFFFFPAVFFLFGCLVVGLFGFLFFFMSSVAHLSAVCFMKDFCKRELWAAAGKRCCAARLGHSIAAAACPCNTYQQMPCVCSLRARYEG